MCIRQWGDGEINGKDDGGHLIGRRFGGLSESDSIIAQDSKLNRGEYKKMEDHWENYLNERDENGEQKYHVNVDIRCKYGEVNEKPGKRDSRRPGETNVYSKMTDTEGNMIEKQIFPFQE